MAEAGAGAGAAAGAAAGLQTGIAFSDYTALSRNEELLRRSFGPVTLWQAARAAERSGERLRDQPVDLAQERFNLYVPPEAPPGGYGVLVFVSPSPRGDVPTRWIPVLERRGMIFVSAENAGNDASPLGRRDPLALTAAINVMKRYPVDPQHVYVSGFSGGSRVALRLAVAYPDLFRGALLMAGSDPLGDGIVVPPADLFRQFQEASRLVYLTGAHDDFHVTMDNASRRALRDFCVFDVDTEAAPLIWHDLPDPGSFDHALGALGNHVAAESGALAACRAGIETEMTSQLDQVEALIAAGKRDEARSLLARFDAHYGGLAAPRSVTLAEKIATGR
jgi:predicted esterase